MFWRARATQGNEHSPHLAHLFRNTQSNLFTLALNLLCIIPGSCQAGIDEAIADAVDLYVITTPFLSERLGHTGDASFARGILGLPGITRNARDRRDIYNFACFGPPMYALLFLSCFTDIA